MAAQSSHWSKNQTGENASTASQDTRTIWLTSVLHARLRDARAQFLQHTHSNTNNPSTTSLQFDRRPHVSDLGVGSLLRHHNDSWGVLLVGAVGRCAVGRHRGLGRLNKQSNKQPA